MGINEAVKELRRRMGESQQQLAERIGVSVRSIARYESVQEPGDVQLARLWTVAQGAGYEDLAVVFHSDWRDRVSAHRYTVESMQALHEDLRQALAAPGAQASKKLLIEVLGLALEIAKRLPDEPEPEEADQ